MNWVSHVLGLDDVTGRWYAFWSGAAGDLGLLGAAYALLRRHNCEVKHCWRVGRHKTSADHMVCRRHHPDGHPTHIDIIRAHRDRSRDRTQGS